MLPPTKIEFYLKVLTLLFLTNEYHNVNSAVLHLNTFLQSICTHNRCLRLELSKCRYCDGNFVLDLTKVLFVKQI